MARIKTSVASRKRKKRVLKKVKGQFGHRSKHISQAERSLTKGMGYSYRDRKVKKRSYRSLWIVRIKAACEEAGIAYSRFIKGLSNEKVSVNRKILADLAVNSPAAFQGLVSLAKKSQPPTSKAGK